MSKFKVGDRVQAIAPCDGRETYIGTSGIVENISSRSTLNILVRFENVGTWWCEESSLKNINQSIMSKISVMMKKLLDADTQTLVKAGYINGDLNLTDEGKLALQSILFEGVKADLVKMATDKIAEEKADK